METAKTLFLISWNYFRL